MRCILTALVLVLGTAGCQKTLRPQPPASAETSDERRDEHSDDSDGAEDEDERSDEERLIDQLSPKSPPWPMPGTKIVGNDQIGEAVIAELKTICAQLSRERVDTMETVRMIGTVKSSRALSLMVQPYNPLFREVEVGTNQQLVPGEVVDVSVILRHDKALTTQLLRRHFTIASAGQGTNPWGSPTSFLFDEDRVIGEQRRQCRMVASTWLIPGTAATAEVAARRALRKEKRLKGMALAIEASRRGAQVLDAWVYEVTVQRIVYPEQRLP